MIYSEFKKSLGENPQKTLRFILPDGGFVPHHFHITEVGHVVKKFIDCGGTQRTDEACVLQVWEGPDVDHRITSEKLTAILKAAEVVVSDETLRVEVECEAPLFAQFQVQNFIVGDEFLDVILTSKHTDCLAKEACGVDSGCGESGCC